MIRTAANGKKIKALLSRAKWSFVVNKSVMKKIKKAVIVDTENNKELECKVRKEGKNHIIELPVVELLQDGNSYTKLIISK
ncbi:hypothetical protein [Treponema zioleckii]|uniref:hypothetical protein n=1 Tax=Treponema zioleckii TaxID=331680 RepID=UPI00168A7F19|nr:hypothetical protein [Treponema zioleckii]